MNDIKLTLSDISPPKLLDEQRMGIDADFSEAALEDALIKIGSPHEAIVFISAADLGSAADICDQVKVLEPFNKIENFRVRAFLSRDYPVSQWSVHDKTDLFKVAWSPGA